MKRKACILLILLILFYSISQITGINAYASSNNVKPHYINCYYGIDYENLDLIDEFNYSFTGEILSYISTSHYNGNGSEIPYTFFKVKVNEIYKGNLKKIITIKFYGGYDKDGVLFLMKNMIYPQVGQKYIFHCNKTKLSYEEDGRTLENSYVVCNEYNMIEYDVDSYEETLSNSISTCSIDVPEIEDGNGESNSVDNISFETARQIPIGYSIGVYVAPYEERYYKITHNAMDYISAYTTGNCNTQITIYDSNKNTIGFDWNNSTNSARLESLISGDNSCYNFLVEKNEIYYISVGLVDIEESGSFSMYTIVDNWTNYDINNYVNENDLVDSSNKIEYDIDSKYIDEIEYSVNEWNKLGAVVIQQDTVWTINDVTIVDSYDEDSTVLGRINYFYNKIYLNANMFPSLSEEERIMTIMHEFGHAIGIDECNNEPGINVMKQGTRSITKLGPADIALYRYLWGY